MITKEIAREGSTVHVTIGDDHIRGREVTGQVVATDTIGLWLASRGSVTLYPWHTVHNVSLDEAEVDRVLSAVAR